MAEPEDYGARDRPHVSIDTFREVTQYSFPTTLRLTIILIVFVPLYLQAVDSLIRIRSGGMSLSPTTRNRDSIPVAATGTGIEGPALLD
jgi:hypothetical protein